MTSINQLCRRLATDISQNHGIEITPEEIRRYAVCAVGKVRTKVSQRDVRRFLKSSLTPFFRKVMVKELRPND